MDFRRTLCALIALLTLAGFFVSVSGQYFDICQYTMHSHDEPGQGDESTGDTGGADGCACLCHLVSCVTPDFAPAVSGTTESGEFDFPARVNRAWSGPVIGIDHPPQLG